MGMLFFSTLFVLIQSLLLYLCNAQAELGNNTFQVGVVLDLDSLVGRVGLTSLSLALDDFYQANSNYTTKLVLHVRDSKGQVIDAATSALSLLKDVEVDAIIGPQKSSQAGFVIGLGDRANVPIISFSATIPLHAQIPYFVQTALDDAAQVGSICALLEYFHWSQVVLIYEESDYGNGTIPYLANVCQEIYARISYRSIIPITATDDFMLAELYKMKTMQTRVFVVHMSSPLASKFFLKVKEAEMMSEGYAWIVTSGVMDLLYSLDTEVLESMQGVLGVKPLIPRSRRLRYTARRWKRKFLNDYPDVSQAELSLYGLWAYDTLWALAMAAERVQVREPSSSLNTSNVFNSINPFTTKISQTGPKLLEAMSKITFQGLAGEFRLVNGKLQPSSFQILNVVGNGEREVGIWTPSQGIIREQTVNVTSTTSDKKLKSITFPGDSTNVPKGWEVPVSGKKLRIGVPFEAGFKEFVNVEKDPQTNSSKVSGCYIDMFKAVMAAMPYAVPYEFFPFEKSDGSTAGTYDDLTYQVFLQNYDAVVGDITITYNRSKYVDFTVPFRTGGVAMITRSTSDDPNSSGIFLKPLKRELWLTAIALFILTGVALWVLEHRFNNAYRGSPAEHAGMIFYFPMMSLVYAQRERIVSNLARLVIIVWMFVVLMLNSTYTASLSARLTIQRLQPSVNDVNELIRKGDYVGCRKESFIFDLLLELKFDKSKIKLFSRAEDIDEALFNGTEKGGISALFAVKPYADLFLSNYGEKYMAADPTYASAGFSYVFRKGSPLVTDVSRAVIELTDNGTLSEIEGHWMKKPKYIGQDNMVKSTRISLESFKTLFAITGGITATCLVVFLARYLYENRDLVGRISNSSITLWSKARAIGKHFDQRDPKSFCSSKDREGGGKTSPGAVGNPCSSSTVVPVSSEEMSDANGDTSPNSQHVIASDLTRSDMHIV